jgi:tellurite resistance protein
MDQAAVDKFSLAMIGAYVWVASSDEGVSMDEYTKFHELVVRSPFASQLDMEHVESEFKSMVNAFETDFEKAMELTEHRLRQIRDNEVMAEEVIRMSQGAIVANDAIDQPEENALARIQKALNG